MIERDRSDMQLVCDTCGAWHDQTYDDSQFRQMIEDAKRAGWTIRPDGEGGWEHFCPDDKPTGLDAQRRLLGL